MASSIPAWSHTFVKIDHKLISSHFPPSDDSRRVVVSYKRNYMYVHKVGLLHLQNLLNIYTSSSNRNNSVYPELPDLIFFIMQIGKVADIFPKKICEKCTLCKYSK